MTFKPDSPELFYTDTTKFNSEKHCRLYYLIPWDKNDSDSVNHTCDFQGWC